MQMFYQYTQNLIICVCEKKKKTKKTDCYRFNLVQRKITPILLLPIVNFVGKSLILLKANSKTYHFN